LDESNCRLTPPSQSSPADSRQGPSSAMSSLLLSSDAQSVAYLLPDFSKDPAHQQQQQKSATRCPEVSLTSLDLSTPSRYATFQRITHLARCAIQHFADCLALPRCSISLLTWLHSYRNLYTAPCCRCDQLLGQDASLPVCRGYSKPFLPQHEFCRPRTPRIPVYSPI
uniref:LIM zinc-binding domain-containing protein n=2 Tax=Schistocephalus solidus TaxID=70667 RepID=A0A183S9Y1_SCHSO